LVNSDRAIGIIPIAEPEFRIPPSCRFPPLREGNRAWVRFPLRATDKGTSVRHGVAAAGAISPRGRERAGAPCCPLPQGGRRGNAHQGALPCAPTPRSHSVGEGLGVRAKKQLQGEQPFAPTPLSHSVGEGLGVRAKKATAGRVAVRPFVGRTAVRSYRLRSTAKVASQRSGSARASNGCSASIASCMVCWAWARAASMPKSAG